MRFRQQIISRRPIFLWNLMIRNSTKDGFFTDSVQIYYSMLKSGVHGSNFTFPLVLKACAKLESLRDGIMIHSHIFSMGYQEDVFVQTALIDMYRGCSNLASSRQVFDEMPTRSLISWNSMISAYCNCFRISESFALLKEMLHLGLQPSSSTFVSIVSGCYGLVWAIQQGLSIHCCSIKLGLTSDMPLSNAILNMYVRYGQIDRAQSMFQLMDDKSVISWTTMISGYVSIRDIVESFNLFNQMRKEAIVMDSIVFVELIPGCVQEGDSLIGSSVHCLVMKCRYDLEESIENSLLSMYTKCGDLISARRIFDLAYEKNVFLWTSMISGYAHSGNPSGALDLFNNMLMTSITPCEATLAAVLSACAELGSLSMGQKVEEYIRLNGLESDLRIQTSLIQMYCKCGSIEKAEQAFKKLANKDLAVWSSMINGYAINGMGVKALILFGMMQREGVKPDAIVYTSVLLACNHSGLIEDGLKYFQSMQSNYEIRPTVEHYICLVDLLGRAGYLDLALKTTQVMPLAVKAQAWVPLLSACRNHLNIQLGELIAKQMLDSKTQSTSNYVLLANMYSIAGRWKEAATARMLVNNKGLVKESGWSQIEVSGSTHMFIAGD